MKNIALLGSTGSIGRQTLDVVRAFPDRLRVIGLAAGNNTDLFAKQIREFSPAAVCSPAFEHDPTSLTALASPGARFYPMAEMAAMPEVDLVVIATSGKAGLLPCLAALSQGKSVALANKEVLVMAGAILTAEAERKGGHILPVDSEHSAVWQCLRGEKDAVARLILTASGGPFREYTLQEMSAVTPAKALKHPTWSMGPKVTVDSASLMNKGMEVIEAHWLFQIGLNDIHVVIHPESIIHSMVEFVDGSIKAQLSYPDMRLPIQFALSYPERFPGHFVPRMDFSNTQSLTFQEPDWHLFPCPKLAIAAAKQGGTYPSVLCAADEVAVDLFLRGRVRFLDIPRIVETALERHNGGRAESILEIEEADSWARRKAREIAGVNE